jgi:hypothetical protein
MIRSPVGAKWIPRRERSMTPRDERRERIAWFGGAATLVEVDTANPATVVDAIQAWASLVS